MKKLIRYKWAIASVLIMIIFALLNHLTGFKAVKISLNSFKEMAIVIPPIFILLGLLDIWVPREAMTKFMGVKSGILGILIAFAIGSAAAGPLYGAFPVAAIFMKKGVKFSNIMIFIGAWSTTKIPMLIFEMTSLGTKFALTRLLIDVPGIIIIAFILNEIVSDKQKDLLYRAAENL